MTHTALATGRLAVITGAAQRNGLAAAEKCLSLGMKVVMVDMDEDAVRRAAKRMGRDSPRVPTGRRPAGRGVSV